jgi:hypothetical protein
MDHIDALCSDLHTWIHGHVPRHALLLANTEAAVVRLCGPQVVFPRLETGPNASAHDQLAVRACEGALGPTFFDSWWKRARTLVPWLLYGPTLSINLAHWTAGGTNLWVRPLPQPSGLDAPARLGVALQPGGVRPGLSEVLSFFSTLGATHGTAFPTQEHGFFWAGSSDDAETLAARVATSLPLWRRA